MMSDIYIGIGSNVDPKQNIKLAIKEMHTIFGALEISPVYQSAAVGFDGDDFLNLVVKAKTSFDVFEVVRQLRAIEDALGRDRSQVRFSKRTIDLDILLYNDLEMNESGIQIPREEILERPFVLKPLCDIAPDMLHPLEEKSYADLWKEMASLSTSATLDLVMLD